MSKKCFLQRAAFLIADADRADNLQTLPTGQRMHARLADLAANGPVPVAELLKQHAVLEVECIDRMYLNVIVGRLQIWEGPCDSSDSSGSRKCFPPMLWSQ
jgi:hypothetical protein